MKVDGVKFTSLILVLSVSVFFTIMFEVFLRIDDASPDAATYDDVVINKTKYKLLETPERISSAKSPILVIGDSLVAGWKCGLKANLTGHMQRYLPENKILNMGRGGTGAFSYLGRLTD